MIALPADWQVGMQELREARSQASHLSIELVGTFSLAHALVCES